MRARTISLDTTWLVVVAWVLVPVATGAVIEDAIGSHATAIRVAETVGAWATWVVTLTAALIRRPLTLTTMRLGTSAGVVAAIAAALAADATSTAVLVVGTSVPVVAFLAAMSPGVGQRHVDGASYGDERRFPLRAPVALLVGPVPLAWATVLAGLSAGPLLLAARQWLAGGVCTAVGVPAAALAARALHGLARRWFVFVPAGVVLHDAMTSREPFLMVRASVSRLGPAPPDTDLTADDIVDGTQGAAGVVLSIDLDRAVELVPRPSRGGTARLRRTNRVAFVPTRPGAVVEEARRRRIG